MTANQRKSAPWPNVAAARSFLVFLAGLSSNPGGKSDVAVVADWLIRQGVGPLAFSRCREAYPELAAHLQTDMFTAVAQNSLHYDNLTRIEAAFQSEQLPIALLKGAALAQTVYDDPVLRTMSDVDIWVQERNMPQAAALMQTLGFRIYGKDDRPPELQMLSRGELQFYDENWRLIELHWSPFPGWWLKRAAAVDEAAIWERIEPLKPGSGVFRLAPEDMIIHVAVHLAVNHQMGLFAVRSLMDMALAAQAWPVDWAAVAERAALWRVGTAVWLPLHFLDQLIGVPGLETALSRLRPSRRRQKLLQRIISPDSVLAGVDLRSGRMRFLFLLLLVDRWRDTAVIIFRTLWPEAEWMQARYRGQKNRWQHLWQIIRHGQI